MVKDTLVLERIFLACLVNDYKKSVWKGDIIMTGKKVVGCIMIIMTFVFAGVSVALADGTETLGPPLGVTLASGTGLLAAGTGLADGTGNGTISFTVPAGATVKQVLIYWEGQTPFGGPLDYTFKVNGVTVVAADPGDISDGGDRIGAPILFFSNIWAIAYRLDITGMGLVTAGPNVLSLTGLNKFGYVTDGVVCS